MPITPFLNGESFDSETTRVMGVALEMTCVALKTGDRADDVKQAIRQIIARASIGAASHYACQSPLNKIVLILRRAFEFAVHHLDECVRELLSKVR